MSNRIVRVFGCYDCPFSGSGSRGVCWLSGKNGRPVRIKQQRTGPPPANCRLQDRKVVVMLDKEGTEHEPSTEGDL